MADNGIGAFARAFGDAFSETHNRRIQQQIAIQAQQNAAIGETLVKSVIETPDLYQNKTFKKAFDDVVGKDNAAGIVEAAVAFQNSPMGMIHQAVRSNLTGAVSAEANGPGTGPSVPFSEIPQHPDLPDQMSVLADRFHNLRSDVVGAGVSTAAGQLHAQQEERALTPPLNAEGLTPAQAAVNADRDAARADAMKRFEVDQAGKAQDRAGRAADRGRRAALGRLEDRQIETPMGDVLPYKVRVNAKPDGTLIETPVTGVKLEKPPASIVDKFQGLNTGLRITDDLSDMFEKSPEEIAQILVPFAGKRLADVQANLGSLTPLQRKFLLQINELRAQRSFALGGKNLTGTELAVFDGILPSVNELATNIPVVIQHARDALTQMGVDTENALTSAGFRAPKTRLTGRNKDLLNHLRRSIPQVSRGSKVIAGPSNPGMTPESELDSLDAVLGQ